MHTTAVLALATAAAAAVARPNFVFIIADDQDTVLGGESPIPVTRRRVADAGARLTNFFVATPVCCPSRTETLTGRYMHNLVMGRGDGKGRSCMNQNSTNVFNADALFPSMHAAGYATGHFGKLTNDQNAYWCPSDPAAPTVTTGFTHISTSCESTGQFWADRYIVKDNDTAAVRYETLATDDAATYSTAQFGNRSTAWIRSMAQRGLPFMAYIGVMAPHLPAQPAPWHQDRWPNETRPGEPVLRAPRTASFNVLAADHFHLLATATELDDRAIAYVDAHMRNRWRSLLAVDDLVDAVLDALEATGVLNNTFVFYTADHGYHLRQWRIPDEKVLPYDTDVRVPFFVRGPGIRPGSSFPQLAGNVDVAPTILALAGVPIPAWMDGKSIATFAVDGSDGAADPPRWRTSFLSEINVPGYSYFGTNKIYMRSAENALQGVLAHPPMARADNGSAEFIYNDPTNAWRMLRIINTTHDWAYVEFGDFWAPPPPPPPPPPGPGPVKPSRWMTECTVYGETEFPTAKACRPAVFPYPAGAPYSDAHLCQKDCDQDGGCNAWLMHYNPPSNTRAPGWRCCKFTNWTHVRRTGQVNTTSGVKAPRPQHEQHGSEQKRAVPTFFELYDLRQDAAQLHNLYPSTPGPVKAALHDELVSYFDCVGRACP